ncbi:MAG: DUF6272 family protein [Gemmatimonadales bacterium]
MSTARVFGTVHAVEEPAGSADRPAAQALNELSLSFVPLDLVTEWSRCSETADFLAQFLAHDYGDRELAANVLSTVINELVENAAKFSSNKSAPARIVVSERSDGVTIVTTNVVAPAQAAAFGETITRLVSGDPEALFAAQLSHPPATGSAGIGLIMLRKDYGATIGARVRTPDGDGATAVDVEVTIGSREIEQR